ncbi:MAG: macro domain-containing protein [Candidatus Zixiibacteriota bacterium]
MAQSISVNGSTLRVLQDDITLLDVDSFVFYAQHNLALGSGFGGAISMRGGPAIQEELKQHGSADTTDVVVTGAGELKAKYIVHAIGPRFQESQLETKLATTVTKVLQAAEEKGVSSLAFPAMGCGFYGVPLETSAKVTLDTIKQYLSGGSKIKDIVICVLDKREYGPFEKQLASLR